jgi:hypothetical protein
MTDLARLATEIRAHAAISDRPGQCASLEAIADRLDTAARDQEAGQARFEQVAALAEKWESATDLASGNPSIVARAFAAEVRKALDGA